ncbi:MAG TPA: TIR domain-containing protein [Anaerolineales bacterium]
METDREARGESEFAIKQCERIIVVFSPDSIESELVEREFLYAASLKRLIIPLMYQPTNLPALYSNHNCIDVYGKNYKINFNALLDALGSPAEIFSKSKEAFGAYRKGLREGSTLPLLEVKLLVVGQGSVGKTSLVNYHRHRRWL